MHTRKRLTGLIATAMGFCAAISFGTAALADTAALNQQTALRRALENNVQLGLLAGDREAAEGRIEQAGLRPNPELEAEITHKLPGEKPEVFGDVFPEGTVALSQLLERGGKLDARLRKARAEESLIDFEEARLRLDIAASVRREFVAMLGAQEKHALLKEAFALAENLASVTRERVAAGEITPIEATRAKVALAVARGDLENSAKELEQARLSLSNAMGLAAPDFTLVSGVLETGESTPALERFLEKIHQNPDIALWEAQKAEREASLALERTVAEQDLTVTVGVTRDQAERETLLFAGISMPLAFNDKNQGSIREASANLGKVEGEKRYTELSVRGEMGRVHADAVSSALEAKVIREEAISGAVEAYEAVKEGYRLGKFRYLDVLDAGTALVETRIRHLEALINLNIAKVELDRLAGEPSQVLSKPAN